MQLSNKKVLFYKIVVLEKALSYEYIFIGKSEIHVSYEKEGNVTMGVVFPQQRKTVSGL